MKDTKSNQRRTYRDILNDNEIEYRQTVDPSFDPDAIIPDDMTDEEAMIQVEEVLERIRASKANRG